MKRTLLAAILALASLSAVAASGPSVADTQKYLETYDGTNEKAPLVLGTVVGAYAALDNAREVYKIPLCTYPISGADLYAMIASRIRAVENPELLKASFTTFVFVSMKRIFACPKSST